MKQDVVVTGLGVIAPNGVGVDRYWEATLAGVSGIGPISRFDSEDYPVSLAGEIDEFDEEHEFIRKLMPQTDRLTRLAIFAADYALADAGIDPEKLDDYAMGVAVSSATGGLEFGQRELQHLWGDGWESVSAYMSFAWYYAVNTGQISIKHGMRGPSGVVISEQSGGLDSIAYGRRQVRKGTTVMTAGGFDGMLCPYGVAIGSTAPGRSTDTDAERAYRPFDPASTGWVPGEGGAVVILESAAEAETRGAAHRYGVVAGYGAAFDPDPIESGGDGLLRAARTAMQDAGVSATDLDVVFADAAGTPDLDDAEATVLTQLFGERGVPVSAPKSMTGRLLSGGPTVDVVAALLCLRDRVIPPALPSGGSVDSRVDLVLDRPRQQNVDAALVLSYGHGGFASAMVLTRP